MSTPLKLVIFDCDGTLVDSQGAIVGAMQSAFKRIDLEVPSADKVRRIVGLSLLEAIAALAPEHKHETHVELVDHYRDFYINIRSGPEYEEPLYPGTREVLQAIDDAGYLMAIATGKSFKGLKASLKRHDLSGRFLSLQTADKVAAGKPAPDMVHNAMRDLGVEPEDTVVIGDTSFDVEMALNAGTTPIAVSWGYHDVDHLKASGADHMIHHFDDLMPTLRSLWD